MLNLPIEEGGGLHADSRQILNTRIAYIIWSISNRLSVYLVYMDNINSSLECPALPRFILLFIVYSTDPAGYPHLILNHDFSQRYIYIYFYKKITIQNMIWSFIVSTLCFKLWILQDTKLYIHIKLSVWTGQCKVAPARLMQQL